MSPVSRDLGGPYLVTDLSMRVRNVLFCFFFFFKEEESQSVLKIWDLFFYVSISMSMLSLSENGILPQMGFCYHCVIFSTGISSCREDTLESHIITMWVVHLYCFLRVFQNYT